MIQPIQVRGVFGNPLYDYVIIHGERRWRAHVLENIPTIKCIILEVEKEDAPLAPIISVIANVAAEVHAPLEIANSINYAIQEFGLNIKEVAQLYGRSSAWVLRYHNLLKLNPKIQAMLRPDLSEDERLSTVSAAALSQYSEYPDFVSKMANLLKGKKIRVEEVKLLLKNHARERKTIPIRENTRKSREETNPLVVFIKSTHTLVNKFLLESDSTLNSRFINVTEMSNICNELSLVAQKMRDLTRHMHEAKNKK